MKKVLLLTAAAALLAMPAFALTIKDTRHNLGSTGSYAYRTTSTSEICVFCHTPHNTSVKVPLWNRAANISVYKMYTGSSTFNGSVGGDLQAASRSRLCLNCHESVATTTVIQGPVNKGSVATTAPSTWTNTPGAGSGLLGKAEIGANADLSNDHPVGFIVNANGTDALIRFTLGANTIGGATNNAFPLYRVGASDGYLECSSCHDPHSKGFRKFLRQRNDSSSLCLTCHIK